MQQIRTEYSMPHRKRFLTKIYIKKPKIYVVSEWLKGKELSTRIDEVQIRTLVREYSASFVATLRSACLWIAKGTVRTPIGLFWVSMPCWEDFPSLPVLETQQEV